MKTSHFSSLLMAFTAMLQCCDAAPATGAWLAPVALAAAPDGTCVYVGCSKGSTVVVMDVRTMRVARSYDLPSPPGGLVVAPDGRTLWVTSPAPRSHLLALDIPSARVASTLDAGHSAMGPVISPDGKTLYVCNRFNNDVGVYDLTVGKEICRIPVRREPVSAALTPDGGQLLVANYLHQSSANAERVGAVVSVIDTAERRVIDELWLPSGSGSVNSMAVSPDGRYAVATHIAARFALPTTQLERGWMNANALTLFDLERMQALNTILLDSVDRGAANPWGAAWSPDGRKLAVAISGTHEVSVADFPAMIEKLNRLSPPLPAAALLGTPYSGVASRSTSDVPNDLSFLTGLRERRLLGADALGPRAVLVIGRTAYVANYFSDTLSVIPLETPGAPIKTIPIGPRPVLQGADFGELCFHNARLCYQQWQSCSSCHPGDGRADGLNWDLLNDGIGNARNTRSLLLVFQTPPCMSIGVRENASAAIRAGVRHILFTEQVPAVFEGLEAYVKSFRPVSSPFLQEDSLSPAALRGKRIFERGQAGCSQCHPAPLFTDLKSYDVGTGGSTSREGTVFDTPTLVEAWRTAPYLHDGSATTVREVVVEKNASDSHGKTSHLTADELNDLVTYLLSL